jgi:hypothetical protein
MLSWVDREAALSAAALTVRAQTIDPKEIPEFFYTDYYRPQPVPSVTISSLTTLAYRPTADRREWDARGRQINARTGDLRTLTMTPVESWFNLTELEIQKLSESVAGQQQAFRESIRMSLPLRVNDLVNANLRRIQLESMQAWANGVISVEDPQGAASNFNVDFQFDTARYPTDGTPWTTSNAYARMLLQIEAARSYLPGITGAVTTYAIWQAIVASAPHITNFPALTPEQVRLRIQEDIGGTFGIRVLRQTHFDWTDGGVNGADAAYWPAGKFALVPTQPIGVIAKAPVARAYDLANVSPEAKINVQEMSVYREIMNNGRELTVEAQCNWMPVPDETSIFVVATGLT